MPHIVLRHRAVKITKHDGLLLHRVLARWRFFHDKTFLSISAFVHQPARLSSLRERSRGKEFESQLVHAALLIGPDVRIKRL